MSIPEISTGSNVSPIPQIMELSVPMNKEECLDGIPTESPKITSVKYYPEFKAYIDSSTGYVIERSSRKIYARLRKGDITPLTDSDVEWLGKSEYSFNRNRFEILYGQFNRDNDESPYEESSEEEEEDPRKLEKQRMSTQQNFLLNQDRIQHERQERLAAQKIEAASRRAEHEQNRRIARRECDDKMRARSEESRIRRIELMAIKHRYSIKLEECKTAELAKRKIITAHKNKIETLINVLKIGSMVAFIYMALRSPSKIRCNTRVDRWTEL